MARVHRRATTPAVPSQREQQDLWGISATMWPVQLNTTDLYTDYQRRGIYIDRPLPRRKRSTTDRIARPLRRTGAGLIRLAERLEA